MPNHYTETEIEEEILTFWNTTRHLRHAATVPQFLAALLLFRGNTDSDAESRRDAVRTLELAAKELAHPDFTREYYTKNFVNRRD